jgi:outer membrane protein OmpA-like peptidoglycan-associated protein
MKKIIFLFCLIAAQLFAPVQVNAQDAAPKQQNCPLPTILFDAGRTNIKQSFYPKMFTVARFMVDNPNLRVKVMGHTDGVEAGGSQLIKRRVEMTINFLVSQFSLDRDRFETDFKNSGLHIKGGADVQYMNRRVEFQCLEEK